MKPRRKPICFPRVFSCMLISFGIGIFIAHIIPYRLLIFLLGFGIMMLGICSLLKR